MRPVLSLLMIQMSMNIIWAIYRSLKNLIGLDIAILKTDVNLRAQKNW